MKRASAMCAAIGLLLLLRGMALAQAPADQKVAFDLAAQPLPGALNAFAAQSNLRILFEAKDAEGLVTERLIGKFTPQTALKLLLSTSTLQYEFVDDHTVEIRSSPAAGPTTSRDEKKPASLNRG